MQFHITTQSAYWRPTSRNSISSLSFLLILVLVSTNGIEAIVKQSQQQQQQPSAQQSRSDDPQSAIQNNGQHQQQSVGYNNLQSPSPSSQSSSMSISSQQQSSPISSPSSASGQASQTNYGPAPASISMSSSSTSSSSPAASQSGRSGGIQMVDSMSGYQQSAGQNQKMSSYLDSMAAAASNPDQSYQAAAQSVNMALANSGIFNSGYQQPQQNAPTGQQQQSGSNVNSAGSGSQSSLNPLHYFYYPSKESSANANANSAPKQGPDMMNNAASNQYQSMASYPSYADQLSSALSSLAGSSSPEASASNQDASYLPQPVDQNSQLYSNGPSGHQQQPGGQQPAQQQAHGQQFGGADMNSFSNGPQAQTGSQSQGNSISFSGPSASMGSSQNNYQNDFMNSHMGAHNQQQGQQQVVPPVNGYQNSNLFNQLGDLSTSNFGNNAGLSSVASYMPPNSPSQQQQQQQSNSHDLFANSLLSAAGQQFNSAASQLAPAVAPPGPQSGASSLFGPASSLFGASSGNQQAQQQLSGQQAGSNLFTGQHYLNSFLTSPQQYQQLGAEQPLSVAASQASGSSVAPSSSGSSSKRFGISSFIMPMLALAGLSLLIPTMSNIGTAVGRKKRSIVEDKASASSRQQQIVYNSMNGSSQVAKETSIGEYLDKIERYYSIYKNAVENDDCLNRLICEFGDAVKDITGKSAVVTVIEKLVPSWMTGKMHLFKEAALDNKEGKEKCKKYICHSSRQH